MSDIDIAQAAEMLPITDIARRANIPEEYLEPYGMYKAKIALPFADDASRERGRLVLVTAITPTPAGEGKTTVAIGLADALRRRGKSAVAALREPSLGPVFGMKGGATGGGRAQIVPMEDINLHFTGDFHAISSANNLLAALIDNHIHQSNALGIDPRQISWKRCLDINDRQLRNFVGGLGGRKNGMPHEDGFDITAASEVMAVMCLAKSLDDLKQRLARIVVGYTYDERPVTAGELKAVGAMTALLKDALKPNLAQTLEGTPALVHGGPFANIAHGCSSVLAAEMALRMGEYVITEAGFGADLGAEKFIDIKCRASGLLPSAAVIVATVRALKLHGGQHKKLLEQENLEALEAGMPNLKRHIANIKDVFGLPCVVALNRFPTDTNREIEAVRECCAMMGVKAAPSDVWADGGKGGEALADEVVRLCESGSAALSFAYDNNDSIKDKINALVTKVYGGDGAVYTDDALKQLSTLKKLGLDRLPVCIAKTQYSFSDNPAALGAPQGFKINVRGLKAAAGAGYIVVFTGDMLTMPGLPKHPAAENIDVDAQGRISGLF